MKWYIWLILIAAVGYVGYWMWKRNRDAKMVSTLTSGTGTGATTTTVKTSGLMTGTL